MIRKSFAVLMMLLGLLAATPAAVAEIEMPTCFPCDGN